MRLKRDEIEAIRRIVLEADPEARIFLFGSRVDDAKKGGDIDLVVLSGTLKFEDKLKIRSKLKLAIGEQKIDIVIASDDSKPFVRTALAGAVEL